MIRFSIKDLENFTEIKAHTIRIWEQRYNLFSPERNENNIRFYSQEDLKKILNINLLYTNGLKISKIAQLSSLEIEQEAEKIILKDSGTGSKEMDDLLLSISALDSEAIRGHLRKFDEEFDARGLYSKVIVPLLIKMGELWHTNALSISHEHLFSNLLREYYIVKINEVKPVKSIDRTALLFLPEHEEHELNLLYFHYLLKEAGYHCIYLGKNVPLKDLLSAIQQSQPDMLVTNLITRIPLSDITNYFNELLSKSDKIKIKAAGSFSLELKDKLPSEITSVSSEAELITF